MEAALISRLEAVTQKLEVLVKAVPNTPAPSVPASAVVAEFDELVATGLASFTSASEQIGGLVKEQAAALSQAFSALRGIIQSASASKKPDQTGLQALIKPLQEAIQKVVEIKDHNRSSPLFNHLSVVAEGVPSLGWVVVEPAPAPYVAEMKDAAQFYVNRVIKEYKGKDETHINWANSFTALIELVRLYVKKCHTTGLTWNPKGSDFSPVISTPKVPHIDSPRPVDSPRGLSAGLASALNNADLTSALRKVDKSEMTHKNPELRASGVVKAVASPVTPVAKNIVPKGPPKLQLDGNKWAVENHHNATAPIVIEGVEIRHVVYIFNCSNSTIQIKGKVNTVTLGMPFLITDNCKKVGLVVESAVSTVDIVNCKSCQLQITGKAPTVNIDKTDGMQLFLSKEGLDTEILTAKSSEMNVVFEDPSKGPSSAEYVEKPISEQFKTRIVDGQLVTVCVEHKG